MDKVHVITLKRTPERFDAFRVRNAHLPIVRVFGADGRTLERDDMLRDGLISAPNTWGKSALGLAMSHVALWRHAVSTGTALHVAEDDAVFRLDFIHAAARLTSSLARWDIVLWAWNHDWPMQLDLAPAVRSVVVQGNEPALRDDLERFPHDTAPPVALRLRSAAGTCGYAISPDGARRMLERCLPFGAERPPYVLKPGIGWVNNGIDVEMSRHYPELDAYVVLPPLAASPNLASQSTINDRTPDPGGA